jgi:hypothetical protein
MLDEEEVQTNDVVSNTVPDVRYNVVEEWSKYFGNLSTKQKIVIATTVPSLILLTLFAVGIGACCFYRRQQTQPDNNEEDVEVILI